MVEIRRAASSLLEAAGVSDPLRLMFAAGGGAFLEALKISKRHSDKDWGPEECPVVDPSKSYLLSSVCLAHTPAFPVDALCLMVDGKAFMSAHVSLSPGCARGIPLPIAVKEIPAAVAAPRRRNSK